MGWISTDDESPFLPRFQMVYLESDTLLSIGDVIYDTLYFLLCELCSSSSTILVPFNEKVMMKAEYKL